jgi:hypothetical protein
MSLHIPISQTATISEYFLRKQKTPVIQIVINVIRLGY